MTHWLRATPIAARCLLAMLVVEASVRGDLRTLACRMGVPLQLDGADNVYQPGRVTVMTDTDLLALRVFRRLEAHWPTSTCLRRALVTGHLLRRRDPRLVIGVRKAPGGPFTAHAWLLLEGTALDEAALDYAPLTQAIPS